MYSIFKQLDLFIQYLTKGEINNYNIKQNIYLTRIITNK